MRRFAVGILSLLFVVDAEAVTQTVPLFPAASENRQGFIRVINPYAHAGTLRITAYTDTGARRTETIAFAEGEEVKHFNSDDLENGNTAKGILTGIGPGDGDWRLELTSDLVFTAPVYMRTGEDGFLTSLHDTVPGDEDGAYRVHIFNPGSNTRQRSILRIVNPSDTAVSATIAGTDDRGNAGRSTVTARIAANAASVLTAQELETMGLGDGAGKWRLRVTASTPLLVMSLMATPTGHLTNLSTAPEAGTSLVPLFPAASENRQGFVRIINETDTEQTVIFRAFDDTATERGTVRLSVGANEATHFNADDLEHGNDRKLITGIGDGIGDWHLTVTGTVRVLSYMRTKQDGFLTALHDTVHAGVLDYQVATFNPASNTTQRSIVRTLNASDQRAFVNFEGVDDAGTLTSSVGTGHLERHQARRTDAAFLEQFFGDGTGKWRLRMSEFGYTDIGAINERKLTVMNLMETPTGHLTNLSTLPAYRSVFVNTSTFPGLLGLLERITEAGGHRKKLVIWELSAGEALSGTHAERMLGHIQAEGVPSANIVVPGPELTDNRDDGGAGLKGFLRPVHRALRAETLVVNRSVGNAFSEGDDARLRSLNMVVPVGAGNVQFTNGSPRFPCVKGPHHRDTWRLDTDISCGWEHTTYYAMRDALNTGKGLMATAAIRRQSGAIVPDRDVYKCGDFMEHCFTVLDIGHTSGATAKLSAMVFHLFQLYESAAEVVRVLKHCAQDIGAPGVDREFGQGLVDLRCSEAMLPVIER